MNMKICELKIKDMKSVEDLTRVLLLNGYEIQSATVYKEYPSTGIDYFIVGIFEKNDFKE